jgi:FdhD protein
MLPNDLQSAYVSEPVQRLTFAGATLAVSRDCAVEAPVNIIYAPVSHAVMMASPRDLEDFALGFSLTEGVIESVDDIRSIEIEALEEGIKLTVSLASDKMQRHLARKRQMAGRTSCGVCGIDDLSALAVKTGGPREPGQLRLSVVEKALEALPPLQVLNAHTHSVHAAGFANEEGEIVLLREDVGRHNALDKLIGALVRAKIDPARGFVVLTSRCSYEMAEKVAVLGARAVVCISAPTHLAVQRAKAYGVTLVAMARGDGVSVYTYPEYVTNDLQAAEMRA